MNGYEKIIKMILDHNEKLPNICQSVMDGPSTCYFNDLKLESDDLFIAEHLNTGYVKKITQSGETVTAEYVEPLKKGDKVIVLKLNDTKYLILERVV